jgi:hypothetical protein
MPRILRRWKTRASAQKNPEFGSEEAGIAFCCFKRAAAEEAIIRLFFAHQPPHARFFRTQSKKNIGRISKAPKHETRSANHSKPTASPPTLIRNFEFRRKFPARRLFTRD